MRLKGGGALSVESKYIEYIKDKDIVLVGPARYLIGRNKGEEIDKYDIVVRMNNSIPIPKNLEKDFGSKTNVLYHRLASQGFPQEKNIKHWCDVGLKWVVVKMQTDHKKITKLKGLIKNHDISWITSQKTVDELKKVMQRGPNQGVITITHLLSCPIKSLTVMGLDFYLTGYFQGYNNLTDEREIEKIREKSFHGRIHDVPSQINYLENLWKNDKRLKIDDMLEEILTKKELLKKIETKPKTSNKINIQKKKKKKK